MSFMCRLEIDLKLNLNKILKFVSEFLKCFAELKYFSFIKLFIYSDGGLSLTFPYFFLV